MSVTVITPTADQPLGMALCEKYMARQTLQPDQWIVADDGNVHADLTMGQTHIKRKRTSEGGVSLAENMLAGLDAATGEIIVIVEHDDWYAPNHIQMCVDRLKSADVCGSNVLMYYNVAMRSYRVMQNATMSAALCCTAFRSALIPNMVDAANEAASQGVIGVDRLFWQRVGRRAGSIEADVHQEHTVVGVKGLPGRPGLGIGHKRHRSWKHDPQMSRLRDWIGDDVQCYLSI